MKPIAIVIPWYGDDIRGGAESEANFLAHCFQEYGEKVEVLTTCVRDASDDRGKNTLTPGTSCESGITVRRFLVKPQNKEKYIPANLKIYNNEIFTLDDERTYFEEDINSPDLCTYIRENKDEYRVFLFIPYLYGVTYNASLECPDKCILIPCLHDESYAYMELVSGMMSRMRGIICHSKPEYELTRKLYHVNNIRTEILGEGIETGWEADVNPDNFRKKYNIREPFVLYAGRKDPGKKVDELISYFIKYKEIKTGSPLKLVLIGGGSIDIPSECREYIIDLGFVSAEDKHNAYAAATVFCNPSRYESFSIVIMESWLTRTPVIVSDKCAVTKNFCIESNGGLYFRNYAEFAGCIDYIFEHPDDAKKMGENGFRYVYDNFTKEAIARKYTRFIDSVLND